MSVRANALFITDQDGCLRQIGLENNNGEINITVSERVTELELKGVGTYTIMLQEQNETGKQAMEQSQPQQVQQVQQIQQPEPAPQVMGGAPM